jgi:outer membrane biosynthesis protein TonB
VNELIFFAVIILFTIIEAISKARKKREGGGEADIEVSDRERLARRSGPREREDEPSEGMIPADIWEEIAGLGQGRRPEPGPEPEPAELAPAPAPTPAPKPKPAPAPTPYGSSGRQKPRPSRPKTRPVPPPSPTRLPASKEAHRMHRLHSELGTDPSERTPSELDWRPDVRQNRNAKRVRAMLRGSEGADALKQAVILREILGPPAAMKDD